MNKEYPIEEELEEAYKTINQLYPIEEELELELMKYRQQIDQLTNNWNELEEWLKNVIEEDKKILLHLKARQDKEILDKMKEIKEGNNDKKSI